MTRALVLHLPAFRLERCGFAADDVAALIGEWKSAVRVLAATPAARDEGVWPGITATEARALVPHIELLPEDASGEAVDRAALCLRLEEFSDRVEPLAGEVDPAWGDALALDVTYTSRGDERSLAERAVALVRGFGHSARAAVAEEVLAARAIAEWAAGEGEVVVAPPGGAAELLAPLPVRALVADPALAAALLAVGVERIGQWARLEPAAVANRYGPQAARLHAIARGASRPRALAPPNRFREPVAAEAPLGAATTQREIALVLPSVLERIERALGERDEAASRLRVVLRADGGKFTAFTVRAGRPTRSARALERLVLARLERARQIESDLGPLEELRVEVEEAAADAGWQPGLADRTEGGEPLPDVVARLMDQLGEQSVFVPTLRSEWRPEVAWARGAPLELGRRAERAPPVTDPVDVLERFEEPGRYALPRPSLLLPSPQPIEVEAEPERGPERVHLEQGWRRVRLRAGPERISGEWWSPSAFEREYWTVLADDRRMWLFTTPSSGRWWLHGWFD